MFELHKQLAADTVPLGNLPLCKVLLMNETQFPWLILVPRRPKICEPYQLSEVDITQLNSESIAISRFMMNFFVGDKLNTASLGNLVPQLHLHHIVRRHTDVVWPKPVWGNFTPTPYSASMLKKTQTDIRLQMQSTLPGFQEC